VESHLGKESLEDAARHVIEGVDAMGGYGGIIAVAALGRMAMQHSTPRMAHGFATSAVTQVIVLNDF
jgi:isoaspartyl peptidase/L-asparaginase-like protein (Ntn-hydrolase superfamily)